MQSILRILEANEPSISAVVGLVTLAAALWGLVQLVLLPFLASMANSRKTATGETAPERFRLWTSLLDRGVDYRSDLMDQVSGRTLNACLIVTVSVSLILLVIALVESNGAISLINLMLFLAAIAGYNLHASGLLTLARWLLIVAVTTYWLFNILIMGTMIGLEYCLGGVLMLPLLLFDRDQKKETYVTSFFIILSLPLAIWAESTLNTTWPFHSVEIPPGYYHGNAIVLSGFVFLVLYLFNRSADTSFKQLEDQQQKSAELIHNLLPAYIAEKVEHRGASVADWHSEASVLFAAVLGFETLYQRVSAVQLVEILRQIFEAFDELVELHQVEKINTLGTNYVAATGIDVSRDASCEQLAKVAIEMQLVVRRLSETADHPFGLRIGISTGDVLSGIIGEARPSFDIWGKTVELAHTMRDDAEKNTIVVNEAAYWRLKQRFAFADRTGDGTALLLLHEKT